jgi:hypothetical protein
MEKHFDRGHRAAGIIPPPYKISGNEASDSTLYFVDTGPQITKSSDIYKNVESGNGPARPRLAKGR